MAGFDTSVSLEPKRFLLLLSLNLRGCTDSIVEFSVRLGTSLSLSDVSDCDMLGSAYLIGICNLADMDGREIGSCVLRNSLVGASLAVLCS